MAYKVKDEREGGLRYTWRGRVYPSVTTIISGGTPKPALVPWAAKMTAEWVVENIDDVVTMIGKDHDDAIAVIKNAPWKNTQRAAKLGTAVHAAAEAHANGEKMAKLDPKVEAYVKSFLRFVDDYSPNPVLTECKVFSPRFDYAGTFDAIVEFGEDQVAELGLPGPRVLLDYKSGKGVYGEVALQLAAYRHAEFYVDEDDNPQDMPEVDACMVVHLRPRSYALYHVQADAETFKYFRAVRKVYEFSQAADSLVSRH